MERRDYAQYVVHEGRSGVSAVYYCNRSGIYTSVGKGIKREKSQGSRKCGNVCTSVICVQALESGFDGTYYPEHFGHAKELGHLSLFASDRKQIAGINFNVTYVYLILQHGVVAIVPSVVFNEGNYYKMVGFEGGEGA